ncbi:MAG: hypothetical protein H6Q93_914 [Nitrospirae bacterium]|jgi:hypothetical protein|nr:hypothetical protein [Nitrospirota bacterium]
MGNNVQDADVDGLYIIKLNYYMYKQPRIKALPAACMLVLFLFVSFFGSEGTLLCFGKDGHMAIEFVDTHDGSGFGAQLAGTENDACGPCKDVQFLSSPAYTRNASFSTQTLPLMSQISPSLPLQDHSIKHIHLPQRSPYKTLASLHSVVLLI